MTRTKYTEYVEVEPNCFWKMCNKYEYEENKQSKWELEPQK